MKSYGKPSLFSVDINFPISCGSREPDRRMVPYSSLFGSVWAEGGGIPNYFETKLSLGGGICDHTRDVVAELSSPSPCPTEHLHVTYFIAAIKINSRSFRMWWRNDFPPVYNTGPPCSARLSSSLRLLIGAMVRGTSDFVEFSLTVVVYGCCVGSSAKQNLLWGKFLIFVSMDWKIFFFSSLLENLQSEIHTI